MTTCAWRTSSFLDDRADVAVKRLGRRDDQRVGGGICLDHAGQRAAGPAACGSAQLLRLLRLQLLRLPG
jgi:hypothetical protein